MKQKKKKGRQISFWCSPAEARKFTQAAKRASKAAETKISRSAWLHQLANEAAK